VEQLLQKHPLELMESLAHWILNLWQTANMPPSDDLESLLNQCKLKTSSTKVDEISRTFLFSNRLHFEQHLFRLNEKSNALQTERDRLQKKMQDMHEEMEEMLADYGNESVQMDHVMPKTSAPGT
jgi:uncharacterized protein YlxW (UPF0749 family)